MTRNLWTSWGPRIRSLGWVFSVKVCQSSTAVRFNETKQTWPSSQTDSELSGALEMWLLGPLVLVFFSDCLVDFGGGVGLSSGYDIKQKHRQEGCGFEDVVD